MKTCPFCAEDIRDEAIKCRWCGSDLTGATPEAPPPAVPQVGEGALQFSHSGTRFLLGYGTDFFGIWDRQTPGEPSERYPRTDDGWRQAWTRYAGLEPHHVAVGISGGGPRPPQGGPGSGGGALAVTLASPWARLGARLLDAVILAAIFVILVAAGVLEAPTDPARINRTFLLVAIVVGFLYEVPLIAVRGQTPGKMALHVRVAKLDTREPPGFGKALLRWLVPAVASVVPFGALVVYVWLLWDRRRQGLHDKAAGTVVVPAR